MLNETPAPAVADMASNFCQFQCWKYSTSQPPSRTIGAPFESVATFSPPSAVAIFASVAGWRVTVTDLHPAAIAQSAASVVISISFFMFLSLLVN